MADQTLTILTCTVAFDTAREGGDGLYFCQYHQEYYIYIYMSPLIYKRKTVR